MHLRLQSVQVGTGGDQAESQLVYADGFLVAVLTRLSGQRGEAAGAWFLETGFGPVDGPDQPPFADLEQAQGWIARRLTGSSAAT